MSRHDVFPSDPRRWPRYGRRLRTCGHGLLDRLPDDGPGEFCSRRRGHDRCVSRRDALRHHASALRGCHHRGGPSYGCDRARDRAHPAAPRKQRPQPHAHRHDRVRHHAPERCDSDLGLVRRRRPDPDPKRTDRCRRHHRHDLPALRPGGIGNRDAPAVPVPRPDQAWNRHAGRGYGPFGRDCDGCERLEFERDRVCDWLRHRGGGGRTRGTSPLRQPCPRRVRRHQGIRGRNPWWLRQHPGRHRWWSHLRRHRGVCGGAPLGVLGATHICRVRRGDHGAPDRHLRCADGRSRVIRIGFGKPLLVGLLLLLPVVLDSYTVHVAILIMLFAIVAVGLSLVMGFGGQVNLAQAAFFGTGAYVSALLSSTYGWNPWLAAPVAVLATCGVALAVALAGLVGGVAGVLYAHNARYVSPDTFGLGVMFLLLAMVIIGGQDSIWGAVVGAVLLITARNLLTGVQTYQQLVYGGLIVATVVFAPRGLAGAASDIRRRFDLPWLSIPTPWKAGAVSAAPTRLKVVPLSP